MNFVQLTLHGVAPDADNAGGLKITRRVKERPSLLARPEGFGPAMELAAYIPAGGWDGAFFFPDGAKHDKDAFFTWAVRVREDLVDLVSAACQPRYLVEGGDDEKKLTDDVKEMLTASGIVLTSEMPK